MEQKSSEKMVDGKNGKEGDWECGGCRNRNYAFRSVCNRCKQPRILVDSKTPSDSKWLPRVGDWICTGCTNNNYASREKCKKCGQPKEVAAMPAVGMPGAPFHAHTSYFPRPQTGLEQRLNLGLLANTALHHSIPFNANWPAGLTEAENFRFPASSSWPLTGNLNSGLPYSISIPPPVPKGWRNGDWICNCGFHNYTSRMQCKKCNAAAPPALGTKRLASEEPAHDWENKRLNAGPVDEFLLANRLAQTYPGLEQMRLPELSSRTGFRPPFPWGGPAALPISQPAPSLQGKGTKQWRDGDWMCTNCNNHNYASRSECNRCKTEKEATPSASLPVEIV